MPKGSERRGALRARPKAAFSADAAKDAYLNVNKMPKFTSTERARAAFFRAGVFAFSMKRPQVKSNPAENSIKST